MTGAALCVTVSPSFDIVAAGSTDAQATIWATHNGKVRHTLTGHNGKINSIKFLRNRSLLATAS
jgi:WD40 repeat protein